MKRVGFTLTELLIVIAITGLLMLILGPVVFVQFPFYLFLGWTVFLVKTLPKMTVEPVAFAVGGAALAVALVVGHSLGKWLWGTGNADGEKPAQPWRFRWTASIAFLVVFTFAAGIALVGTVHEVGWIFTSDERMVESSSRGVIWRSISLNNLKQIGMGMELYHHKYRRFASGGTFDRYGDGLHSWETMLLPYLENPAKPNVQLPWRHPENEQHFKKEISVFLNPALRDYRVGQGGYALSHYSLNSHVARANVGMQREEVRDGLSNTIMAGEVNRKFKPWGDPVNWRDPSLGINKSPDGFGGGKDYGGSQFLLMDGSVQFLSETIDPEVLKALSTPAGGEKLDDKAWKP